MSIKQLASFGLRLAASIFLLLYLFKIVRWEQVWSHLERADLLYLGLYLLLGCVNVLVSSIKWLVLARAHRMSPKLSFMVSLYLVGYFFNNFLPTSLGGDVVRGHALGKAYGKQAEAMASVFVERLTGYTALIVFALLALAFDGALRTDIRLTAPIAFAVLAYVGIVWAMVNSKWLVLGAKWIPVELIRNVLLKVGAFQQAIQMYRHERQAVLVAAGYSILFYLVAVVIVYVGCLAFHATVSFFSLLTAVPVLLILFMIPLSIGGIGLQEWAFYFVLGTVGVPAPIGLSLGLVFRAQAVGFALLGGAIYPFLARGNVLLEARAPAGSRMSAIARPFTKS